MRERLRAALDDPASAQAIVGELPLPERRRPPTRRSGATTRPSRCAPRRWPRTRARRASRGSRRPTCTCAAPTAVAARVRDCWASFFSERALFYRAQKGSLDDLEMAVVVQRMVEPDVAGILFTVDPVQRRRDQMVVEAVFGLGETAVSGSRHARQLRDRPRRAPQALAHRRAERTRSSACPAEAPRSARSRPRRADADARRGRPAPAGRARQAARGARAAPAGHRVGDRRRRPLRAAVATGDDALSAESDGCRAALRARAASAPRALRAHAGTGSTSSARRAAGSAPRRAAARHRARLPRPGLALSSRAGTGRSPHYVDYHQGRCARLLDGLARRARRGGRRSWPMRSALVAVHERGGLGGRQPAAGGRLALLHRDDGAARAPLDRRGHDQPGERDWRRCAPCGSASRCRPRTRQGRELYERVLRESRQA